MKTGTVLHLTGRFLQVHVGSWVRERVGAAPGHFLRVTAGSTKEAWKRSTLEPLGTRGNTMEHRGTVFAVATSQ
jgi:hypothetical protein